MSIWNSLGYEVFADNWSREQGSVGEADGFEVDVATSPYAGIRLALWAVDGKQQMVKGGLHINAVLTPEYAAKLRDNLTEALEVLAYKAPAEAAQAEEAGR